MLVLLQVDSDRTRVGLVLFSDGTQPQFDLDRFSTRADIIEFISNMVYPRGRTNTADAIRS